MPTPKYSLTDLSNFPRPYKNTHTEKIPINWCENKIPINESHHITHLYTIIHYRFFPTKGIFIYIYIYTRYMLVRENIVPPRSPSTGTGCVEGCVTTFANKPPMYQQLDNSTTPFRLTRVCSAPLGSSDTYIRWWCCFMMITTSSIAALSAAWRVLRLLIVYSVYMAHRPADGKSWPLAEVEAALRLYSF